jgi:hypothetical protein
VIVGGVSSLLLLLEAQNEEVLNGRDGMIALMCSDVRMEKAWLL